MNTHYFTDCADITAARAKYIDLVKRYHPDIAGVESTAIMQAINSEYDYILDHGIISMAYNFFYGNEKKEYTTSSAVEKEFRIIIQAILARAGSAVTIEICGSWVWITGNTRPHAPLLKELHCKYAPKKQAWYYRTDEKSRPWFKGRRAWDLNTIRRTYGSREIREEERKMVAA